MRKALAFVFPVVVALASLAQQYDVVIANGRVMDPETGLDAARKACR